MKTLIHRLGYCLVLLIVIVSCSQPESEEPVIDTSLELAEVSSEYMDELMVAYKTFVENLPEEEKEQLFEYVNNLPDRSASKNERATLEVSCRCLATQASCSAVGKVGECCICWDPKTQIGACGVYAGIASCKAEERPRKNRNPDTQRPTPTTTIRIYPSEIKNLVDYIERSRLGISNNQSSTGLADFKKLLGKL